MEGAYEEVSSHSPFYKICSHIQFYRQERLLDDVTIALVGKYTDMQDSYMSVVKSLEHSAFRCNRKLKLKVRRVLDQEAHVLTAE